MIYADYLYYQNQFFGRAIPEADFSYYAARASAWLDAATQGRAKERGELEGLKQACCAAAEAIRLNDQGGGVISESNDGISVAYARGSSAKTDEQRVREAVRPYLAGTGLLYRGVKRC